MPELAEQNKISELELILEKAETCGADTEKLRKILYKSVEYGVSPEILKDMAPMPSSQAVAQAIKQFSEKSEDFQRFINNTQTYCPDVESIQDSVNPVVYLLDHNSLLNMVTNGFTLTEFNLPCPTYVAGANMFTPENEDFLKSLGSLKFKRGAGRSAMESFKKVLTPFIRSTLENSQDVSIYNGDGRSKTGNVESFSSIFASLLMELYLEQNIDQTLVFGGAAYSNLGEEEYLIANYTNPDDVKHAQQIDVTKSFAELPKNVMGKSYNCLSVPENLSDILMKIDPKKELHPKSLKSAFTKYINRRIAQTVPIISKDILYTTLWETLMGKEEAKFSPELVGTEIHTIKFIRDYNQKKIDISGQEQYNSHFLQRQCPIEFLNQLHKQGILELKNQIYGVTEKGVAYIPFYAAKLTSIERTLRAA